MNILIKNGLVHKFIDGKSYFEKRNIVIKDDKIDTLMVNEKEYSKDINKIIDASNCIIIPGLVNAHLHSHDHFNKGAFEKLPLEIWMLYLRPFFKGIRLTPDEIYIRTLCGCIEMLKTGTTTIIDDIVQNPPLDEENLEMIMKAYKKSGIRANVTTHLGNKPIYETIPYLENAFSEKLKNEINKNVVPEKEILLYLEKNLKKYNTSNSLVRYVLAPSAPQRCTLSLMEGIKNLSVKYNVPSICHVLETKVQNVTGKIFFNKTLVEYLEDNDLLYPNLSLVHSVWVVDNDIEIIKEKGCKVIHNPASNLKLGSGVAPIRKFLDKSITVSLGTDNTSSNDSLNMFETMKLTGLIHNVQYADYNKWIGANEAFKMATVEGAKSALLENEIGSIEKNKKADLVILNINNERFIPTNNLVNHLVYAENGSSVKAVIIDGKIVVEDGNITTFNEKDILDEVKKIMPKIYSERKTAFEESIEVIDQIKEAYFKSHQFFNLKKN